MQTRVDDKLKLVRTHAPFLRQSASPRRQKRRRGEISDDMPSLDIFAMPPQIHKCNGSSQAKRKKMCSVSGCPRPTGGDIKCAWHKLWSWSCPCDTLTAMFSASCSTHPDGADRAKGPAMPSKSELVALLKKYRRLIDVERMKLGAGPWPKEMDEKSKSLLFKHRKLINRVIDAMAKDICRLEDMETSDRKEPSINIASSVALKSLVEKLYNVGLMCRTSVMSHVEEPYLLIKVRWFQLVKMDGRANATASDVKAFFHHLLDTNDPLAGDLIHFQGSHLLKFMKSV